MLLNILFSLGEFHLHAVLCMQLITSLLHQITLPGVPIALCCIAPILAAKVFGSSGVEITLGKKGDESKWPYGGALDAARSFGAKVVEKNVNEVSGDNPINSICSVIYATLFLTISIGLRQIT